ncbi:hypothetical protein VaNZ11_015901 [Volvox africanus]|uniref:Uncharacterized protein n=1 Tax=Volvox africanus TaxID=51714 RepID=A0ABQ5SMY3_9CHLO|nr:hypothetical protein VaNZ11_015901 [Volvox africanus]
MRRASEPADAVPITPLRSARSVAFNERIPRMSGELPRNNRYRIPIPSDSGRDDATSLLKDFDAKLQSIQEVLTRYQVEKTTQARGGAGASGTVAGGSAAVNASGTWALVANDHFHPHSHDRPVSGSSSAPSSNRRWQSQQQQQQQQQQQKQKQSLDPGAIMDEEVFVRHVLASPRRVKSAVPGASRALSARIDYYRTHRDKAEEKAEKAREEQLLAQRENTNGFVGGLAGPTVNFIEANRRSIVPNALPLSIQMTIDSIRDQGLSSLAACSRRRGATGRSTGSGTSVVQDSNRSSRPWSGVGATPSSTRGGAGGGLCSAAASSVVAPWTNGTASVSGHYSSRAIGIATGIGGGGAATGAGWVQPGMEWEASEAVQGVGARPSAGARHTSTSWDGGGDGANASCVADGRNGRSHPSVFLTGVDLPAANANEQGISTGATSPVSSREGSPGARSQSPAAAGGGVAVVTRQRPVTANSISSTHGTYTYGVNGVMMLRASANSPGTGTGSGTGEGSLFYGTSGNAVDTRRLRLALSARPASGGSPTSRMEYIAEQAARRVERAIYAAEVRERAAAIDAERRRNIVAASEQRAALRREEEARQVQARALAEKQERQRQWTAIVGLCSKLSFVAERIMEDRRVRALRALRKSAAVKIATWYKGILLRRRQVELVSLIRRLRGLLRPYLARQRLLVRQRCAARIVSFLEYTRTSNMAVVGVRRLKAEVEVLQSAWRNALLVRNMQRQILYNQLTRLEREIVSANKRAERTFAGQMFRLGKSVNILEPEGPLVPAGLTGRSYRTLGAASARLAPQQQHHQHQTQTQHQTHQQQQPGYTTYDALAIIPAAQDANPLTARGKYDRMRQPYRGVLLHEGGVEEEDEVLRGHMELVPREVREQVVNAFLLDARREHRKLLEQYSTEKMLYQARKPIEELRQKMLRDAGLTIEPDTKPPVMPHMRLVYPRAKLKELLRRAVEINQARLAAAEERRQQEAAEAAAGRSTHWLDLRHGGGGVLWADLAGGGGTAGGGAVTGAHGALSRTTTVRKTFSRVSHRGTSHRSLKVQPPSSTS